jgi:hypothetical protein
MSHKTAVGLACCVVLLGGCATLFASGPDKIPIQSNPAGARVTVDNLEVGVTPMVVTLDRKSSQGAIKIEAPGYQPYVTKRSKSFQSVALLNCLGLLPWVIDLATGNYEAFDDTGITANLVPGGAAPMAPPSPPPGVMVPPSPPAMAPPPQP